MANADQIASQMAINKKIIDTMRYEYSHHKNGGIYGYTQTVMAYNSNRIEGSRLSEEHTASLFDTQTIAANGEIIRSKDVEETTGHFQMFIYMLDTIDEPLSEDMIKKFHYYLKSGVFEDMANGYNVGEYKGRNNRVSNLKTADVTEVRERMRDLLSDYRPDSLDAVLRFHADYEHIHPFQDGNGRTGRIILFRELLHNGFEPCIVRDANKPVYSNSLHIAQVEGDIGPFRDYIRSEQDFYRQHATEYFLTDHDLPDEKPKKE